MEKRPEFPVVEREMFHFSSNLMMIRIAAVDRAAALGFGSRFVISVKRLNFTSSAISWNSSVKAELFRFHGRGSVIM